MSNARRDLCDLPLIDLLPGCQNSSSASPALSSSAPAPSAPMSTILVVVTSTQTTSASRVLLGATENNTSSSSVSAAAIVIPVLLVLLIGAGVGFFLIQRRRRNRVMSTLDEKSAFGDDAGISWVKVQDTSADDDSVYGGLSKSVLLSRPPSPLASRRSTRLMLPPLPLRLAKGKDAIESDQDAVARPESRALPLPAVPTDISRPVTLAESSAWTYMLSTAQPTPATSPTRKFTFAADEIQPSLQRPSSFI